MVRFCPQSFSSTFNEPSAKPTRHSPACWGLINGHALAWLFQITSKSRMLTHAQKESTSNSSKSRPPGWFGLSNACWIYTYHWFFIIYEHPSMFRSYSKLTLFDIHYSPPSYTVVQVNLYQPSLVFTSFYPFELGPQDFRVALWYSFSAPTFTSQSI